MNDSSQVRRYATTGGMEIAADVGGDPHNPAVILLHGGGQTRHSWGAAARELRRRGYHVINYDARGHGDSGWAQDADYSLDAFSADLAAIIRTLPSPPALVGASLGGSTSLFTVGSSDAPMASALILVDVVPAINPEGRAKIEAFMRGRPEGFATVDEAADAVAAYNPHRPRPNDSAGLLKNLRRRDDGRLYWHWDPQFLSSSRRLPWKEYGAMLERAALKVRVPTLLVRGLFSDIVTDAGVEALQRDLPQLEVYNVAGAGHMVAGDRNDAFNAGVLDFLARHHPAR